tara:strand:+ start:1286 stop:1549 length:264 start_codon:yes stop_codon:yes gene_type:complete
MTEITPIEKKMGTTWKKLIGHLCCEPCYKHFVMALARIEDPNEVSLIQEQLLERSKKKKLPLLVNQIFDRKVKLLTEIQDDNKKETS